MASSSASCPWREEGRDAKCDADRRKGETRPGNPGAISGQWNRSSFGNLRASSFLPWGCRLSRTSKAWIVLSDCRSSGRGNSDTLWDDDRNECLDYTALLMFLLRIGADMSGRVYDRLTALLVSAVVILLPAPRYMYDAGFLLSYGAIAAICLLFPVLQKLGGQKYCSLTGMWKKIVDGLYASIAIQLFLFPVTLYFFFEIPLYGVLLNVLVIPLMSVVLGAGLLGSLFCGVVPFIGETLLKGTGVIFSVYDILCENTGKLPLSRIVLGKPKWQQVVACYLFLVIFCIYIGKKMQKEEEFPEKWRKKESIVVLGVILAVAIPWRFPGGKVEITMLDVGQGDGLFIRGPSGGNYMIDGGSSDVKEVGRYRLESFLKAKGVGTLDYVLISHGDGII